MKFFIDENLSRQLAEGMKGFGEDVMRLKEKFSPGANDTEWLPYVGNNNMTLVTRDESIRRRPVEKNALKTHKVGAFFLGGKNRTRCQLIQQVVRHWPRMKELSEKTNRPFAFRIPPSGTKITKIEL